MSMTSGRVFADEELAYMLQNELFLKELESQGFDFGEIQNSNPNVGIIQRQPSSTRPDSSSQGQQHQDLGKT